MYEGLVRKPRQNGGQWGSHRPVLAQFISWEGGLARILSLPDQGSAATKCYLIRLVDRIYADTSARDRILLDLFRPIYPSRMADWGTVLYSCSTTILPTTGWRRGRSQTYWSASAQGRGVTR